MLGLRVSGILCRLWVLPSMPALMKPPSHHIIDVKPAPSSCMHVCMHVHVRTEVSNKGTNLRGFKG